MSIWKKVCGLFKKKPVETTQTETVKRLTYTKNQSTND